METAGIEPAQVPAVSMVTVRYRNHAHASLATPVPERFVGGTLW